MRLVVDASVVVQVALAGAGPTRIMGRHELSAPPILASEVTAALAELAYRREVSPEVARAAMLSAHGLGVRVRRPARLYEEAWDLAVSLGWAKTYEAEYVALARLDGIPLLTIDERMRRGVRHIVEVLTPAEL